MTETAFTLSDFHASEYIQTKNQIKGIVDRRFTNERKYELGIERIEVSLSHRFAKIVLQFNFTNIEHLCHMFQSHVDLIRHTASLIRYETKNSRCEIIASFWSDHHSAEMFGDPLELTLQSTNRSLPEVTLQPNFRRWLEARDLEIPELEPLNYLDSSNETLVPPPDSNSDPESEPLPATIMPLPVPTYPPRIWGSTILGLALIAVGVFASFGSYVLDIGSTRLAFASSVCFLVGFLALFISTNMAQGYKSR